MGDDERIADLAVAITRLIQAYLIERGGAKFKGVPVSEDRPWRRRSGLGAKEREQVLAGDAGGL
jgi:hypothetical protein